MLARGKPSWRVNRMTACMGEKAELPPDHGPGNRGHLRKVFTGMNDEEIVVSLERTCWVSTVWSGARKCTKTPTTFV
jgi:hypothetical protein